MSSLKKIKRKMELLYQHKDTMTDIEYLEKSNKLLKAYNKLKSFKLQECYASSITYYSNGRILVYSRMGERYI